MRAAAIFALYFAALSGCLRTIGSENSPLEIHPNSIADLENVSVLTESVDLSHYRGMGRELLTKLKGWRNLKSLDLSYVYLSKNDFEEAPLPSHLETLTLRGWAGRGSNFINDKSLKCLQSCKSLRHLKADYLDLDNQGIKALENLKQLETLSLDGSKFTGEGLQYLKKIKGLSSLSLNNCAKLEGRYLQYLAVMPNLRRLSLINTHAIDDESLAILSKFTNLEELLLPDLPHDLDHVTEVGWKCLNDLPHLKELRLTGCSKLSDASLSHLLSNHPELEVLCIVDAPNLTDAGFEALAGLQHLQNLCLKGLPKVGNTTVKKLSGLSELLELELRGTQADAAGVEGLSKLSRLISLESDVPAGDELLKEVGAITTLQNLVMSNMQASDTGIANLRDMASLESLYLTGDKISDRSVKVIAACKKLRMLALSGTHITSEGLDELARALPRCVIVMDANRPKPKN